MKGPREFVEYNKEFVKNHISYYEGHCSCSLIVKNNRSHWKGILKDN